jgi:adenylyl-sulfate kinase
MSNQGHVFWLFGLSGAGKSTLADALRHDLFAGFGERALRLDGDSLRLGLCQGLGFSDDDRTENLRRAAEVAHLGLESGFSVVASFITPQEGQRRMVESIVGVERISLVYVDAPLAVCQQRDVKGLYAKAATGGVSLMTGVSAFFERPFRTPALQLDTAMEPAGRSAARLKQFARQKLGLPAQAGAAISA